MHQNLHQHKGTKYFRSKEGGECGNEREGLQLSCMTIGVERRKSVVNQTERPEME